MAVAGCLGSLVAIVANLLKWHWRVECWPKDCQERQAHQWNLEVTDITRSIISTAECQLEGRIPALFHGSMHVSMCAYFLIGLEPNSQRHHARSQKVVATSAASD
eukprot:gb/GFBE01068163.1/.p1 GENE.gb/GFBE01068163.1/~~gb/GFBE01068163.1/.p1  ORF type:complete len:105 (+),score=8.41 gb/GFBE01068163.1/:1-315(+)